MSRLLAAILIRSRTEVGTRNEMVVVDDFRFGRRTRSAFDQSRYSVESCVSQKCRSASSLSKSGIGLSFVLISSLFPGVHVAHRYRPNQCPLPSQRERGEKSAIL